MFDFVKKQFSLKLFFIAICLAVFLSFGFLIKETYAICILHTGCIDDALVQTFGGPVLFWTQCHSPISFCVETGCLTGDSEVIFQVAVPAGLYCITSPGTAGGPKPLRAGQTCIGNNLVVYGCNL